MQILTIARPSDMHLHLHDGDTLKVVAPYTTQQMDRTVIIPNLKLPVVNVTDAQAYKTRTMTTLPGGNALELLIVLYLTDDTTPELVREARTAGIVTFKLCPTDATTNSDLDATDLLKLIPLLEETAKQGILFLVHGEVTDPEIDTLSREATFIERVMKSILAQVPNPKVAFKHITTAKTTRLVLEAGDNVATFVTPQYLLLSRNGLSVGGVRPYHSYLPVLRRGTHRQTLIAAITGDKAHGFFLGTGFMPHAKAAKENVCDYVSVFSVMTTIGPYAEVFERAGILGKLGAFVSRNGPCFYGLPEDSDIIILVKQTQTVSASVPYGDDELIPMRTDGEIEWTV